MLEVSGLSTFHGRAQALHGLDLALRAGEVLVLLGRNGAGKSTALKSLIGLLRPASGRIRFQGEDIAALEPFRRARRGIGYVAEERRIFAGLTVAENLDIGRQAPRPGLRPWTPARLFDLFPSLGRLRDRPGGRISGGEQQMLAVARTLMGNPRLLLLDEPTEGLSPLVAEQVMIAVAALKGEGLAILLAEQNLRHAEAVGDGALVIEGGRAAWRGTLAALRADAAAQARYLAV